MPPGPVLPKVKWAKIKRRPERLLERQKLVVFFKTSIARAQPVPVPLPPIVFIDLFWGSRNVASAFTGIALRLPRNLAVQLWGARVHQRLLERQKTGGLF